MAVLFRNATVIDGSGERPFEADVLVRGTTIEKVSPCGASSQTDAEIIDATGKILCPGFMDMHAHSDLELIRNPSMPYKIQQGITFDLSGNCGIGVYPWRRGDEPRFFDIIGHYDSWDWTDYKTYSEKLNPGINCGFLQSHSCLRINAIEGNPNREATDEEIRKMCSLLETSLEQGCFGFSTGLYYAPCMYAGKKEILALLSVVKMHDGIFAVHHRCEGDDILSSIDEILSYTRETGVRLEISHLKAIGRKNQAKVPVVLEKIHRMRDEGFDVAFDQYPYEYGSTSLFSLLPPDVLRLSPRDLSDLLERTKHDRELRTSIVNEMMHPHGWDSISELCPWEDISIVTMESSPEFNGMNMVQVAETLSMEPYDALLHILSREKGYALMSDITQSSGSLRMIFEDPLMCFGTDALYTGPFAHPRSANGAIHLLYERCIKERYSFESVIRKMTSEVSRRLRIKDRGLVREGCKADLVLFDPKTLKDNSDMAHPFERCSGLDHVMVNGTFALKDGKLTDSLSGMVLKRKNRF